MIRELLTEDTGLDAFGAELDLGDDPLAVRAAMIRLEQLERDEASVKATKAAVVDAYDRKLSSISEQARAIRSSLQVYCERFGKASFPDVGTVYLANEKAKISVVDRDAFRDATAAVFVKEAWDETWAKSYALERATVEGELLPGVELVPGGPAVRVRKA